MKCVQAQQGFRTKLCDFDTFVTLKKKEKFKGRVIFERGSVEEAAVDWAEWLNHET